MAVPSDNDRLFASKSVFAGVVRNENAHTELLSNLLNRSHDFLNFFLSFVAGGSCLGIGKITTQQRSNTDGIPDLLIERSGQRNLVLEIKTRVDCPVQNAQTGSNKDRSYENIGEVYFLVPRNWKLTSQVSYPQRTWEDLVIALQKSDLPHNDELLREYLSLLLLLFPSIQFTKGERALLSSTERSSIVQIAIKLHRVVDSLAEMLKGEGHRVIPERKEDEYGCVIQLKETKTDLLWVGMWAKHNILLGAGYDTAWSPLLNAPELELIEKSSWRMLDLSPFILNEAASNITQVAFDRIQPLLTKLKGQVTA